MTTSKNNKARKLTFIPEILYEAPSYPGEKVSTIPYMTIPSDKDMPGAIFLGEYRQTGEFEVGDSGRPEEIMDGPYMHMFVDFKHLEEVLLDSFPDIDMTKAVDTIRVGLGMQPLRVAKTNGAAILDGVVAKANEMAKAAFETQQERKAVYDALHTSTAAKGEPAK